MTDYKEVAQQLLTIAAVFFWSGIALALSKKEIALAAIALTMAFIFAGLFLVALAQYLKSTP